MQCVTIFSNIYECVSEESSGPFTDILRTKQDSLGLIRQNENSFQEIHK